MPVAGAIIGGVAALGGAAIASSGAKKAAKTQAQAAQQAQDAQERMFQQQVALQEPFRQGGMAAQQQLMYLLGVGSPEDYMPKPAPAPAPPPAPAATPDYGSYVRNNPDLMADFQKPSVRKRFNNDIAAYGRYHYSTFGANEGRAIPSGIASLPTAGGAFGMPGVNIANLMAARQTTQPVASTTVPARMTQPSGTFGELAKPFGMDQFQADPGYAFRQAEGMKALERSAAARGGLMSGSALKGIQRFGQDLASQEYTNAFNRYQVERAARLNPLQSLMGSGQSSANTLTSAAGQYGQTSAQNAYNAGAARASGYVGSANAMTSALGNIGQMAMQYPLYQAQANYMNSLSQNPYSSLVPSVNSTIASNPSIF